MWGVLWKGSLCWRRNAMGSGLEWKNKWGKVPNYWIIVVDNLEFKHINGHGSKKWVRKKQMGEVGKGKGTKEGSLRWVFESHACTFSDLDDRAYVELAGCNMVVAWSWKQSLLLVHIIGDRDTPSDWSWPRWGVGANCNDLEDWLGLSRAM